MTSKTIKTALFALLVLSITVPSTVFATTHDSMGGNMTDTMSTGENATSSVITGENMTSTENSEIDVSNATSTEQVEINNSTETDITIPLVITESWENIRGETVSVFPESVEKLQDRGYLVTSS